jgi:hypothetical protein
VSTTGRGRGSDDDESPLAPPIPSFASLRAPRRSSPALDLLAPAPAPAEPSAPVRPAAGRPAAPPPSRPAATPRPPAPPRPAEWPDLLWFGVRVATAALRLPGVLVREPARRLLRLLGE